MAEAAVQRKIDAYTRALAKIDAILAGEPGVTAPSASPVLPLAPPRHPPRAAAAPAPIIDLTAADKSDVAISVARPKRLAVSSAPEAAAPPSQAPPTRSHYQVNNT